MFDERIDQRRTDAGDDPHRPRYLPGVLDHLQQVVEYEDATFEGNPYLRSDFINKLKVDKSLRRP